MNYRLISCLCGGFLLAVLWFDLMHDVAIYPYLGGEGLVANDALLTVQTYYRRVLVDSSPMSSLVALVMVLAIGVNLARVMKSREPVWLRIGCLVMITGFVLLQFLPSRRG